METSKQNSKIMAISWTSRWSCLEPPLHVLHCLVIALKQNKSIKGIPVQEIQNLLGQFADNIDIYIKLDQNSLSSTLMGLEKF